MKKAAKGMTTLHVTSLRKPNQADRLKTRHAFMPRVLSVVLPALFLVLFAGDYAQSQMRTCDLKIITTSGITIPMTAEIADTEFRRMKGLMFRESMADNRGMLFLFEHEQHLSFWMKNTYIPLSIAYIDRRGIIMEIYDMKPLDTSITYPSMKPAKYALEVNQGWFRMRAITPGSRLVLDGCISK